MIGACAWAALICRGSAVETPAPNYQVLISVPEQRLAVVCGGELVAKYAVSTSRYGTGDQYGSYRTPLGDLRVIDKIGGDLPPGAVIRHRAPTGEVIPANAPGRDPIVTRVIWLDGLNPENRNARSRGIYIHGTPEERTIGTPASYGCIRMRSRDVIKVFDQIPLGTTVSILADRLPHMHRYEAPKEQPEPAPMLAAATPTITLKPAPALEKTAMQLVPHEAAPALLPAIGEGPEKSSAANLRAMKGSILLANLPGADDRHSSKSPTQ